MPKISCAPRHTLKEPGWFQREPAWLYSIVLAILHRARHRGLPMSGYFGTEVQQRLQAQAEASVDFINVTPGACQTGRTMGCDDPDRFGWELIDKILNRDGICGFRMIPASKADELKSRLAKGASASIPGTFSWPTRQVPWRRLRQLSIRDCPTDFSIKTSRPSRMMSIRLASRRSWRRRA